MIMVMIALAIFNLFHFWITIKNFTSHEFISKVVRKKGSNMDIEAQTRYKDFNISMYDISLWENFKQINGCNPICWFLPVRCCRENTLWDNGMNFKVNIKHEFEVVKTV